MDDFDNYVVAVWPRLLRLSPAEGERMTEERFREMVGLLVWP